MKHVTMKKTKMSHTDKTIVVIGGGIAGTSCIEALFQDFEPSNPQYNNIILISERRLVKKVTNYVATGRQLESFDVAEANIDELNLAAPPGLQFEHIVGTVKFIDPFGKSIVYGPTISGESKLSYDILCLCHGSTPRQLNYTNRGFNKVVDDKIIIIRDTNTVDDLRRRLNICRRLVIVGNGGIGLELVSKIADCEKIWIIRDESIGCAYFDSGAAKFLLDSVTNDDGQFCPSKADEHNSNLTYLDENNHPPSAGIHYGPALGPNWSENLELRGSSCSHKLDIVYQDEVVDVVPNSMGQEFPIRVLTKKSEHYECDMIVTAIGVEPNNSISVGGASSGSAHNISCPSLERSSSDGGILVDIQMRTSLDQIYAAGDVISCENWPTSDLWFQMRLWTQARQMGYYAGRCISAHIYNRDPSIYFNFDCFTHCTSFFGHKLILLGKFNGQQIDRQFEVIARVDPKKDYIKILVGKDDGRIIGAVLVGGSGLEETIENLIYDQIDVSAFKTELLDNTIDIEDYFD